MHRGLVIATATALALTLMFTQSATAPERVAACYCVQPRPLAEYGVTGEHAILLGTLGPAHGGVTPIVVDGWFHGAHRADTVWVQTGTGNEASCDYPLNAGERRIFVLYGPSRGVFSTNICLPSVVIGTNEAARLVAEAEAAFGPVQPPPPPEPGPERPVEPSPPAGAGLAWIAGGIALGLVVLGGTMIAARRRRLS